MVCPCRAFLARQLSHIERFAREEEISCEAKTFNGGFKFVGVEPDIRTMVPIRFTTENLGCEVDARIANYNNPGIGSFLWKS